MALTVFFPSRRKTSFFQKNIRQFIVELTFPAVLIQNLAIAVFSDVGFSAKLNAKKKIRWKVGQQKTGN